jgi:hypothetical protein
MEQEPDHPLGRRRLAEQVETLFKEHAADWTAGLPSDPEARLNELGNFRRGMLERVEVRYDRPWDLHAGLFRCVDLRTLQVGLLEGLAEQPWLNRLVSLELKEYVDYTDRLEALLGSPALAGLVHLGLSGWAGISAGVARALASSLRLPALASLEIDPCSMGDEGVRVLAAADLPATLRKLILVSRRDSRRHRITFGLPGLRALASSPALAGLEHLDVTWNRSPAAGVEALVTSPFLTNLKTLILRHGSVGNKGAKALATSASLKRLVCLDLSGTDLLDEAVRSLARSANLANLTVLDLGGNRHLGDAGVSALAGSAHLTGLRALSLSYVPLTVEGTRALAQSSTLANLDTLDLSNTRLGGPAARELVASPHLNNLAVLDLRQEYTLPPAAKAALRKRWPFARL